MPSPNLPAPAAPASAPEPELAPEPAPAPATAPAPAPAPSPAQDLPVKHNGQCNEPEEQVSLSVLALILYPTCSV